MLVCVCVSGLVYVCVNVCKCVSGCVSVDVGACGMRVSVVGVCQWVRFVGLSVFVSVCKGLSEFVSVFRVRPGLSGFVRVCQFCQFCQCLSVFDSVTMCQCQWLCQCVCQSVCRLV